MSHCSKLLLLATATLCGFSARAEGVYDTAAGRWLQRDIAGYVDGPNLYQYASGSPAVYVDPSGLAREPGEDMGPPFQLDPDHELIRTPDDLPEVRGPFWNPYDPDRYNDLNRVLGEKLGRKKTLVISCHGNVDIGPYTEIKGKEVALFPIDLTCPECAKTEDQKRQREEWVRATLQPIRERFSELWIYACNCGKGTSARIMQCLADELGIPVVTQLGYCGVGPGDRGPKPKYKPSVKRPGHDPEPYKFLPGETVPERERRIRERRRYP